MERSDRRSTFGVSSVGVMVIAAAVIAAGCGLQVGGVYDSFGGLNSRALIPSDLPAATTMGPPEYSQLFDNGIGFTASYVLRRPQAGAAILGDTYALIGVDYRTYPGKVFDLMSPTGSAQTYALEDMTVGSLWIDAKTMLRPLGSTGSVKPYLVLGIGVTWNSEVGTDLDVTILESDFKPSLRAAIGLDFRKGRTGFFLDIGAQIMGAPPISVDMDTYYNQGEEIVTTPMRVGLAINF